MSPKIKGSVGNESPKPPGNSSNAMDSGVRIVISINNQSSLNNAKATIAKTIGRTTIQNCSSQMNKPSNATKAPPIQYNQLLI